MIKYRITGNQSHVLIQGDSLDVAMPGPVSVLVLDPDWDKWNEIQKDRLPLAINTLAFTSPRFCGQSIQTMQRLPEHVFAWDCAAAMEASDSRPLRRLKLCLWYGKARDFELKSARYHLPEPGNSGKTRGKRLQELFKEPGFSIREVVEKSGHPYAKPIPWVRALIAGVSRAGPIYDPFAGSGSTLFAADELNRESVSVEIRPDYAQRIIRSAEEAGMMVNRVGRTG